MKKDRPSRNGSVAANPIKQRVAHRKHLRASTARRLGVSVQEICWLNGRLVRKSNGTRIVGTPEIKKSA